MKRNANLIILGTFVVLAAVLIKIWPPAAPVDTYYHLSVGRYVFQEKKIPQEDIFIYAPKNRQITNTEWVSGLIFFTFVKQTGIEGLYIPRLIFGLLTLYFFYKSIRLFVANPFLTGSILLLTGYIITIRFNDRPEIFSLAFISVINFVCLQYFFKNKLSNYVSILPFIFLLWPSVHAFASIGISIFALFAFLTLLEKRKVLREKQHEFFFIFLICVAVLFLQYKNLLFIFKGNLVAEIMIEMFSLKNFYEYYGFFGISQFSFSFYFVLLICYLVAFLNFLIKSRKGGLRNFIPLFIICLFYLVILTTPFKFVRLMQVSILMSTPILVFLFSQMTPPKLLKIKLLPIIFYVISITVVIFLISSNRFSRYYTYLQSQINPRKYSLATTWGEEFPSKIPLIINSHLETKRIFASNYWNSYFIWFNPQTQVYSDIVFETTTPESFGDEIKIASGLNNWDNLLEKYNIDTIINKQPDARHGSSTPVYNLNNWKLVFLDNIAALYARTDIIKSLPVELSAIHPELPTDLKFTQEDENIALEQLNNLLIFDPTNDFARIQLILYWRDKNLEKAKILAEESMQLLPKNPWFSYLLASINAKQGNCETAKKLEKETVKKALGDDHVKDLLKKSLDNCNKKI